MGLNDTAEMLEAAQAQSVLDERTIARVTAEREVQIVEAKRLQRELDAAAQLVATQAETLQQQSGLLFRAGEQTGTLWRERHDLEQTLDRVRVLCRDERPWDEADADSAEARSARAYNHALAKVLEIIGRQAAPSVDEHDRHA